MFCHGVGFLTPQNEKTDQNPGTVAAMAGRLPWAVAALLAWATIMGKIRRNVRVFPVFCVS